MNYRLLSKSIEESYAEVSMVFGNYQIETGLICPKSCAKCCFKADISCAPIELLPMAFHLIDENRAEEVLEKAKLHSGDHCFFLNVISSDLGSGQCSEYQYRPFICRAFGLSARHGKNNLIERSICKTLNQMLETSENIEVVNEEIPFIDLWKKNLENIDPAFLEKEVPINQALVIILEKLLLLNSYQENF